MSARELSDTPSTAGLAAVPGPGTNHAPVGDAVLRPSTASAMPAWGALDDAGRTTVRPTTTPGPPVASTSAE